MTTLQLAERLVLAALGTSDVPEAIRSICAVRLLEELRRNDCWFCRVTEDDRGVTVETPLEDV